MLLLIHAVIKVKLCSQNVSRVTANEVLLYDAEYICRLATVVALKSSLNHANASKHNYARIDIMLSIFFAYICLNIYIYIYILWSFYVWGSYIIPPYTNCLYVHIYNEVPCIAGFTDTSISKGAVKLIFSLSNIKFPQILWYRMDLDTFATDTVI